MAGVTLLDVAQRLGLSRATVSLVLRESPLVAAETRARVLEAFGEMGYVYNRHAARMRAKHTHTVAMVINDITNPYFSTLARAVEGRLGEQGFVTFLSNSDESVERQGWFLRTVRQHSIDGIVVCPAEDSRPADLRMLSTWGIPCVFASRYVKGLQTDYAGINNRHGMMLATQHLLALGHRRIALIGGLPGSSTGRDRLEGYLAALASAGIARDERMIVPSPLTRSEGKRIIIGLLAQPEPPTAAVCGNDVIAFGAMLGLRSLGLEPGRDFSLTGFDDVAEAGLWEPALTTVRVDQDRIGREAADLLLARMAEPDRKRVRQQVEPSLVVRGTTAPPPTVAHPPARARAQ